MPITSAADKDSLLVQLVFIAHHGSQDRFLGTVVSIVRTQVLHPLVRHAPSIDARLAVDSHMTLANVLLCSGPTSSASRFKQKLALQ